MDAASASRPPVWVEPGHRLPDPVRGIDASPEPGFPRWPQGLVAAGNDLSPQRLLEAYGKGIFPWYAPGQPVLWWSPDPRMVLDTARLRVHRSLQKTMRRWARECSHVITIDKAFASVIAACAAPRDGEDGTWITPAMQQAYIGLHRMGHAHSVEIWRNEPQARDGPRLVGGLYGVSIGRMFFGESMFARQADASKVALAALVAVLRPLGFPMIDCQQETRHLASMGASQISRDSFLERVHRLGSEPAPDWRAMSRNDIPIPCAHAAPRSPA